MYRKDQLNINIIEHTGKKPFNICNKTFVTKVNLNIHMYIKYREKPFEVNICNEAFSQKRTLHVHMRVQSGSFLILCVFQRTDFKR